MARGSHAGGGLIAYFTRHGTIANLLLAALLVFGLWAASVIRAQYFPDVVVAEVEVTVQWEGAGADDVDRGIVQVLEPALLAVDGVVYAFSMSREGGASIELEFAPGADITAAADAVQLAVDAVNTLPDEADDPVVRQSQWRDGVTDVVITGPVGADQLARFADEFVGRLFAAGVTRTTIQGLVAPETVVEVPSTALLKHDVTLEQIAEAIAAGVATAPVGEVAGGTARVRTGQERRTADEIAGIVLKSAADGTTLTIGDVAAIRVDGATRGRAAFVGDNPAMTIRVDRTPEGDAIRMQADVAEAAAAMQEILPPGVTIDLVRTRAEQITDRLALLLDNGLMGLVLVLILLFLFLNARAAIWVAAGIPVAMFTAVGAMYLGGVTLNMISLFALIIMIGVVVDDGIVVAEHADFRARTLGEDPMTAAEYGARRMGAPVIASTLTTIIAFWGLVVIGGRFGDLIADIPFTVIAVLLASLVECFLILPRHMIGALRAVNEKPWYDAPSRAVNRGMIWFQNRVIKPLMRWVMVWRYPVLALCVLALASQIALFQRGDVQFRFFNAPEQSSITGNFAMLPSASREDSLAMMRELQRAVEALAARLEAEHGTNPVTYVLAEVGGGAGRGLASAETKDADLLGGISIELVNPDLRPYSSFQFIAQLEEEIRRAPLLEELSFRGGRFGPGGDAIAIDLYGADAAGLKAAAEDLKAQLAQFPEVSALEDSLSYDKEELILNLTPQGQAMGFAIDDLGRALRNRLNGIEAATYPDGPRAATIRVELPAGELTADFLDRTQMRAPSGVYVPLADVVTVVRQAGFSSVMRENGLQVVTVSGDLAEDDPERAAFVDAQMRDVIIPAVEAAHGVSTRLTGAAAEEDRFLTGALQGLILALIGIYLCLAWIFESWTRPMVVMAVIPFGLVGAIFGHWHWDIPMSMFSIVGMIGMSGIIINDAIVLISTVDEYAAKRGIKPAIIDAVADRFRPVLLTTATTVLGLAPLLFERSSQAEFLKPTIVTLCYGLGFGMVLVLLVIPALLAAQVDIGRSLRAARRGLRRGPVRLLRATALVTLSGIALIWLALLFGWWEAALRPGGTMAALGLSVAIAAVVCTGSWLAWRALRPHPRQRHRHRPRGDLTLQDSP
jgi:multidrug efflux pump subunit AcrB